MKKIDLNKTSDAKINHIIHTEFGGRYALAEILKLKGVGQGSMMYHAGDNFLDQHHSRTQRLKVNFEIYKNGIGIYFRNFEFNFLYLCHPNELTTVLIKKEADMINPKTNSLYSMLRRYGKDHNDLRGMLRDDEVIELYPLLLNLTFSNGEEIHLEGKTNKIKSLINFFNKISSNILIIEINKEFIVS